jgi:hypothetical protein
LKLAKKCAKLNIMIQNYEDPSKGLTPVDIISNETNGNGNTKSELANQIFRNRDLIMPGGFTPHDEGFLEARSNLPRITLDYIKSQNESFIRVFDISAMVPINQFNTPTRKSYEVPYCQGKFTANGLETIGDLITAIANCVPLVCFDKVVTSAIIDYLNDNGISAKYNIQQQLIELPDIIF